MRKVNLPRSLAGWAGVGLVLMEASQPAAAFGGVGSIGECTSFTTCTAALGSSTVAFSQYQFSNVLQYYPVPQTLNPVVNGVSLTNSQVLDAVASRAPSTAAVGVFCLNCATDNSFFSSAIARAASDFAVNRAAAESGFGAIGGDDRGGGTSASVRVTTGAQSQSAWRDAWTFSNDGRLSATIALDGVSSNHLSNSLFPITYTHLGVGTSGDWYYDFKVWDVDNLSISDYFEVTPGPTLVAMVRDRSGINNEQRPTFASSLALDFNYFSGVHYVVTAELGVQARNGRTIDLYSTARLQDVVLSNGAQMNALSGHDYVTPVPEPQPAALLLAGLALFVCLPGLAQRRTPD